MQENPVREMVKTTMPDDLNGNGAESIERWARKKKAHADAVRLDPATALQDEKRKFHQYVAGCPSVRVGTLKYRPDVLGTGFLRLQAEEEVNLNTHKLKYS